MKKILAFIFNIFRSKKVRLEEQYYVYVASMLGKDTPCRIYSLYRDDITTEVTEYFKAVHADQKRKIQPEDIIHMLGAKTEYDELYVFLSCTDLAWDNYKGYFHKVEEWPSFTTFVQPIEEVFAEQDNYP